MQEDRDYEARRLHSVLEEIKDQIDKRRESVHKLEQVRITTQKAAWEDLPRNVTSFEDLIELSQERDRARNARAHYDLSMRMLRRLEKALSSPYFARIDFGPSLDSDGTGPLQIYIGISSVQDSRSGKYLVYDWRAPVSSMFYDYEPGRASYRSPRGPITGDLLLKRQFRIDQGRILFMFDSSVTINDEILQETLAGSTGGHLRTIVYTIQREQNRIIRDDAHRVLIVQGPAGSGKTQIALHRAAYLLYKHRQTLRSDNIAIFSPNRIFADYISGVLPELGEYNVGQTTFAGYARKSLQEARYVEDVNDQIEYLLSSRGTSEHQVRVAGIKFKASRVFLALLKAFPSQLERSLAFHDIVFNGSVVASQKELESLLSSEYTYLPLFRRIDKIKRRVLWLLEDFRKEREAEIRKELSEDPDYISFFDSDLKAISRQKVREEMQPIMDYLESLNPGSIADVYSQFLHQAAVCRQASQDIQEASWSGIQTWTMRMLDTGLVPYEDTAHLLLLKGLLEGFPKNNIRHVIIDEAQDYTLAQYEVIHGSFPSASFTILGDLQQAINPYMNIGNYDNLRDLFGDNHGVFMELRNTYRSTRQITEFCQAILPVDNNVEPMDRPGQLPVVVQAYGRDSLLDAVASDIHSLCDQGFRSVAVICKTASESEETHSRLKQRVKGLQLLSRSGRRFKSGPVVIPSYLAKGLEFDAVIVYRAEKDSYFHEGDDRLLYTACTRALHRLHLYCQGELSPFLPSPDSGLYEFRPIDPGELRESP